MSGGFFQTAGVHGLRRRLDRFGHLAGERFDGKRGDRLRLALVEELEVFPLQIANRVPLLIADDYGHQHEIDFGAESRGGIGGSHLFGLVGGRWRGLACRGADGQDGTEAEGRTDNASSH